MSKSLRELRKHFEEQTSEDLPKELARSLKDISDSDSLCDIEFKSNFRALSEEQRLELSQAILKVIGESANNIRHSHSFDLKYVKDTNYLQLTVKEEHTDHRVYFRWNNSRGSVTIISAWHADYTH